jgi:ribonucleotide monophosphatase NagD (HAD superfamily)
VSTNGSEHALVERVAHLEQTVAALADSLKESMLVVTQSIKETSAAILALGTAAVRDTPSERDIEMIREQVNRVVELVKAVREIEKTISEGADG